MKLIKICISLLAAVSLVACGSDDDSGTPAFKLSNETISGTYETSLYEVETESVGIVGGQTFTVVDTEEAIKFQDSELVLANGTFTFSGLNTVKFKTEGEVTNDGLVVNFDDEGTYVLDVDNEKITFNSTSNEFLVGEFSIESISDSKLTIIQTDVDVSSGSETITTVTTYSFNR